MAWKDMKQVIDRAVAQNAFVHPWMHLIECSLRERDLKDFYRPLFEYVLELQAKGKIENVSFKRISQVLAPNAARQRAGAPR